MVVQVAVRPPVVRVRAQVLQQLVAHAAPKAPRVPPHVHRAHDPPDDRPATPPTDKPAPLRSLHSRVRQRLLHPLRLWLAPPLVLGRSGRIARKRDLRDGRCVVRAPDVDRRYPVVVAIVVPEGYPRQSWRRRAGPGDIDHRPVQVVLVAILVGVRGERNLRDPRCALRRLVLVRQRRRWLEAHGRLRARGRERLRRGGWLWWVVELLPCGRRDG